MNRWRPKTRKKATKNLKEPGPRLLTGPGSGFAAGTFSGFFVHGSSAVAVHDSALGAGEGIPENQSGAVEERLVDAV